MTDALATPAAVQATPTPPAEPPPTAPEPTPVAIHTCPTCMGTGRATPVTRPCKFCGTAIAIGREARRSNSRYCTDSCRQNGYRARKKSVS